MMELITDCNPDNTIIGNEKIKINSNHASISSSQTIPLALQNLSQGVIYQQPLIYTTPCEDLKNIKNNGNSPLSLTTSPTVLQFNSALNKNNNPNQSLMESPASMSTIASSTPSKASNQNKNNKSNKKCKNKKCTKRDSQDSKSSKGSSNNSRSSFNGIALLGQPIILNKENKGLIKKLSQNNMKNTSSMILQNDQNQSFINSIIPTPVSSKKSSINEDENVVPKSELKSKPRKKLSNLKIKEDEKAKKYKRNNEKEKEKEEEVEEETESEDESESGSSGTESDSDIESSESSIFDVDEEEDEDDEEIDNNDFSHVLRPSHDDDSEDEEEDDDVDKEIIYPSRDNIIPLRDEDEDEEDEDEEAIVKQLEKTKIEETDNQKIEVSLDKNNIVTNQSKSKSKSKKSKLDKKLKDGETNEKDIENNNNNNNNNNNQKNIEGEEKEKEEEEEEENEEDVSLFLLKSKLDKKQVRSSVTFSIDPNISTWNTPGQGQGQGVQNILPPDITSSNIDPNSSFWMPGAAMQDRSQIFPGMNGVIDPNSSILSAPPPQVDTSQLVVNIQGQQVPFEKIKKYFSFQAQNSTPSNANPVIEKLKSMANTQKLVSFNSREVSTLPHSAKVKINPPVVETTSKRLSGVPSKSSQLLKAKQNAEAAALKRQSWSNANSDILGNIQNLQNRQRASSYPQQSQILDHSFMAPSPLVNIQVPQPFYQNAQATNPYGAKGSPMINLPNPPLINSLPYNTIINKNAYTTHTSINPNIKKGAQTTPSPTEGDDKDKNSGGKEKDRPLTPKELARQRVERWAEESKVTTCHLSNGLSPTYTSVSSVKGGYRVLPTSLSMKSKSVDNIRQRYTLDEYRIPKFNVRGGRNDSDSSYSSSSSYHGKEEDDDDDDDNVPLRKKLANKASRRHHHHHHHHHHDHRDREREREREHDYERDYEVEQNRLRKREYRQSLMSSKYLDPSMMMMESGKSSPKGHKLLAKHSMDSALKHHYYSGAGVRGEYFSRYNGYSSPSGLYNVSMDYSVDYSNMPMNNKNSKRKSYSPGYSPTDYPELVISNPNGNKISSYYSGTLKPKVSSKANTSFYPNNYSRTYM